MNKYGFLNKILFILSIVLAFNTLNPIVNQIEFQANSQERFTRQGLVCSQIALARAYELDNGKEANRAVLGASFINSGEILPRGRALGLNNVYVIKAGRHSGIVANEGFSHEGLVGLLRNLKSGAHAHLVFIYKARQPGLGEEVEQLAQILMMNLLELWQNP